MGQRDFPKILQITSVFVNHKFFTCTSQLHQSDIDESCDLEKLRHDTLKFLERVRDPKTLDTKYIPLKSKKSRGDGYTVSVILKTSYKPESIMHFIKLLIQYTVPIF